jgi:hypothetical protein
MAATLAFALTPACGVSNLSFQQDHRLTITSPANRSTVTLPVAVEWTVKDVGDSASYAVFVDRAPQPPGQTVAWLFRGDDSCATAEACADPDHLARANIYTTDETRVVIDRVPRTTASGRDLHEIVIVLLDEAGRRRGESAFRVDLEVEREDD